MIKVFIVIVNYNGQKYLPDLFASLEKTKTAGLEAKIVVVDNASTDNSLHWLKARTDIHLITNQTNTGFATGNNQGMQYAIERGADYVYLLNQDTEVDSNFLTPLITALEQDKTIGAAQSLLLLNEKVNNQYLVNSWGNKLHFLGFGYCDGLGKPAGDAPQNITPITYASGAGVIYRVTALREVGLFDDSYFLYHEDTALSLKLRLAGYKIVSYTDSRVIHKFDPNPNARRYYFLEMNRYRILLEFYKWPTLLLIFPAWLIVELGLVLISFISGWWRERFKAYWWVLTHLKFIMSKRRAIQQQRKLLDKDIVPSFTSEMTLYNDQMSLLMKMANPILGFYWFIIKHLIVW